VVKILDTIKDIAITIAAVLGSYKAWLDIKEHKRKRAHPRHKDEL